GGGMTGEGGGGGGNWEGGGEGAGSSGAPRSKDNGAAIRRRGRNTSICRITIGQCRASASERNRSISLWSRRCWRWRPFRIAQPGLETKPHFHHLCTAGSEKRGVGLRHGGHHHAEMEK